MMVSRLYPIMGVDGKVEECVFASSDVTSRRRAEERLRFQAKLLDNVREAVVAIDLQGLIIYWGGGAETLYGYRAEETLGLHLFDIFQEGFGKPLTEATDEEWIGLAGSPTKVHRIQSVVLTGGEYKNVPPTEARMHSPPIISVASSTTPQIIRNPPILSRQL